MSKSYDLTNPVRLQIEKSRLGVQAGLLFPFESSHLPFERLPLGERVLDLGCGTGAYLQEIHRLRPDLNLCGADRSEDLLAQARETYPFAFRTVDLESQSQISELVSEFNPRVIVLRYVAQHLSQPTFQKLLETLHLSKSPQCVICLIEAWDPQTRVTPSQALFEQLLTSKQTVQASNGGNRYIAAETARLAAMANLQVISESRITVTDQQLGKANWWSIVLPILKSSIQLDAALLRSADQLPEITEHAQLGISVQILR